MNSIAAVRCPQISLKNGTVSTRKQARYTYLNGNIRPHQIDRRPQYLSTASFSCNSGFTLVGYSVATCMANSKWNVPLPNCTVEPLYRMLIIIDSFTFRFA